MYIVENIKSSITNIKSHIMRTVLTLLGITIGVFAVISLSSSVYIVKSTIKTQMKDLGWDNSITVYASTGEDNFSFRRRRHFGRRLSRFMYMHRKSSPLTLRDYNDIKNEIQSKYCYASITDYYAHLQYVDKNIKVYLIATNYDYLKLKKFSLYKGRFFNNFENGNHVKVCILSYPIAKELSSNPEKLLGHYIKISGNSFRVIGITKQEKKKNRGFVRVSYESDEKSVFIPLTTGIHYLRNSNKVDEIYVQATDPDSYEDMKNKVRQILLRNHNMAHDFSFFDVGSFMLRVNKELNDFMKRWSILFITIAGVSLLVGGIGLFSTLIISITERMNEIGVRKSIGAKNSDIFMLFISEALILSLIAAILGFGLSYSLLMVVSHFLKQSYSIPMQGIVLGFSFSLVIGFLSGLYPAIKAAKINPTEAIYYFQ